MMKISDNKPINYELHLPRHSLQLNTNVWCDYLSLKCSTRKFKRILKQMWGATWFLCLTSQRGLLNGQILKPKFKLKLKPPTHSLLQLYLLVQLLFMFYNQLISIYYGSNNNFNK